MEIFTQDYWKNRLELARKNGQLHKAVFEVGIDRWENICKIHADALLYTLNLHDSVLDVGCGYGRLLESMPPKWCGEYVGIDLSEDFISHAIKTYPGRSRKFYMADFRAPIDFLLGRRFDWAVVAGTRPMIVGQAGASTWERIEKNIFDVTDQILYLEYDDENPSAAVEIRKKT